MPTDDTEASPQAGDAITDLHDPAALETVLAYSQASDELPLHSSWRVAVRGAVGLVLAGVFVAGVFLVVWGVGPVEVVPRVVSPTTAVTATPLAAPPPPLPPPPPPPPVTTTATATVTITPAVPSTTVTVAPSAPAPAPRPSAEGQFFAELNQGGIRVTDPVVAVAAAQEYCRYAAAGRSDADLARAAVAPGSTLSPDEGWTFLIAAKNAYCPELTR